MPLINDDLLKFDSLDMAEKLTGKDYHTDKETSALGFLLLQNHSEYKKTKLMEACDTYYSQPLENYLVIVYELGFNLIYSEKIPPRDATGNEDLYFIFSHPDGIILEFDSYNGMKTVNGGRFYYNWRPNDINFSFHVLSSGHFARHNKETNDYIWSGNHDCREALKYSIERLRTNGSFVTPWIDCPVHWFSHYGDKVEKNEDYTKIGESYRNLSKPRIKAFPKEIKELYGPRLLTLGE